VGELLRELGDDPVAQRVGDDEDLRVDAVVRRDVVRVVTGQA
jgi:hypothetical protein